MSVVTNKINSLLKKMTIPYPLPLGKDAVLSGSSIWHVLTADEHTAWTPHDVDVFCTPGAVGRFRKLLHSKGFKLMFLREFDYINGKNIVEEWTSPEAPDKVWREDLSLEDARKYYGKFCDEHKLPWLPEDCKFAEKRNYRKKTVFPCVQMIYSHSVQEDAKDMVVNKFDFPVLENYFDGSKVYITHPSLVDGRYSTIRKEYMEQSLKFSWCKERLRTRVAKYQTYGLRIYDKVGFGDPVPNPNQDGTGYFTAKVAQEMTQKEETSWPDSGGSPTLQDAKKLVFRCIFEAIHDKTYEVELYICEKFEADIKAWLRELGFTVVRHPSLEKDFLHGEPAILMVVSWRD